MKNNYILREDDNQWQKLVEQLPVMIFESSVDNNILYVSENVFDTLGYTPKELIGKNALAQFHPADRERLLENIRKKIESGGNIDTRYHIRKKNGDYIAAIFRSVPVKKGQETIGLLGAAIDISATEKLESELADSEARYRSLFDNASLGIYRTTPAGEIVITNDALIKILGFDSLEELQQMNLESQNNQTNFGRKRFKEKLEKEGQITGLESLWTRKDGKQIWIRENATLIKDEKGTPLYYNGVVEDVTFQKGGEMIIQKQQDLLNMSQQMAQMGSWEEDFETGQVFWSPEEYRIFGVPQGTKLTEALFLSKLHPADKERLHTRNDLIAGKEGKADEEYRIIVEGKIKWIRSTMESQSDNTGKIVRLYGMDMDITKEKNQQLQLEKESAMLKKTQKLGRIGSWELDVNTKEVKASKVLIDIYRLPPKEHYTLSDFTRRIHPDDMEARGMAKGDWSVLKEGKFDSTYRLLVNEKVSWVKAVGEVLYNEEKEPVSVVAAVQDITRQKQLERELIKEKEVAEEATRAKSLFLANMSHEIRTPLNAILGFSHILSKRLKDPVQKEYVISMQNSGEALLNLINDLLDLSKAEAGKMEFHRQSTDVRFLVHDIESFLRLKAMQKQLDFKVTVAKNVPRDLFVDELKIRQILLNLTSNAIKFTEKGFVKIHVRAENIKKDKASLVLEVQDTGKGIPAQYHEKIFQLFEQQDTGISTRYGGTGLGLAIIQQIVSQMNGHIELDSEEGKGSLFRVILPDISQTGEKGQRKKQEEHILQPVLFEPATVLIVDDTENNRHVLKGFLEDFPFTVLEAKNGRQALQRLSENKVDLVFMDIRMPVIEGMGAVKKIRASEEWSHIPIVALTASSSEFEEKKLEAKGFNTYLRKPASMEQIEKTLRVFLPFGPVAGKENIPAALSEGVLKNFHALMKELEEKVMPLQRELLGIKPRQKVRTMAQLLLDIGKNRKAAEVIHYGKRLMTANMNFQLEKEKELIDNFTLWMEQLKEGYNK